jgi:putative inorganic carbon (HCO3(-)) transporter
VARDLVLVIVYAAFLVLGATAPFVFGLGYLWVDTFYPQDVSYSLLKPFPVAFVMGACTFFGYLFLDRRSPPRPSLQFFLMLLYGVWMTASLTWSVVPADAYVKWDWAFKGVMFATFVPFVFRSRVQIEAFLQVFLFSAMATFLPSGLKTMVSGGGYGQTLSLLGFNVGIAEGSFLAAVSISLIPLVLYLREHSILVPPGKLRWWGYTGMIPILIACAIGTYERTALIGFAVVGAFQFLQVRRKFLYLCVCGVLAAGTLAATSSKWSERIQTVDDYKSDSSALGRILVWEWTIKYTATHPLGGGFRSNEISEITFPRLNGEPPVTVHGKAFHNIYMEVLGELGYPGLAIFLSIVACSMFSLRTVFRRTRGIPQLAWCRGLAGFATTASLTLLACGMFIGIGFQPLVWYLLSLPICLRAYLQRVDDLQRTGGPARIQPRGGRLGTLSPAGARIAGPVAAGRPSGVRPMPG